MAETRIGTSGWHYDHWRGVFYPGDAPPDSWLQRYADRFDTVEINNSFYQLPERETLEAWRGQVPAGFCFAVKGSRYMTHRKKLSDPEEPVDRFTQRTSALGGTLGPVLFQLPPHWHVDVARMEAFLAALPDGRRHAMEFRDDSWHTDDVYAVLEAHGVAFCVFDLAGRTSPKPVTADFVYIRLHGPVDPAYQGSYDARSLAGWAGAISSWRASGRDVYCYFNNDAEGHAPKDAARLREMLA